jgi:hypothetical protein
MEVGAALESKSHCHPYQLFAVCGSDVHAFLTEVPKYLKGTIPDPLTGETLPITLGHEFVVNSGFLIFTHWPYSDSLEQLSARDQVWMSRNGVWGRTL